MKTTQIMMILGVCGIFSFLTAGCAERQVTTAYVPVYTVPPENSSQPTYVYHQTYYPSTGGAFPAPPPVAYEQPVPTAPVVARQPAVAPPPPPQPAVAAGTVVQATVAPPPPRVEVIPVAPGPTYVWVPGYWWWNHGAWVWVRGCWMARPRAGAVWVAGHWARYGYGYVWVAGHWR